MMTRTGEELRGGSPEKGAEIHSPVICSSSDSFWWMIFHTTIIMLFHNEIVLVILGGLGPAVLEIREMFALLTFHVLIQESLFRKYHMLIPGDADFVLGYCAVFLVISVRPHIVLFFVFFLTICLHTGKGHFPVFQSSEKKLMEHEWIQMELLTCHAACKLRALFCFLQNSLFRSFPT